MSVPDSKLSFLENFNRRFDRTKLRYAETETGVGDWADRDKAEAELAQDQRRGTGRRAGTRRTSQFMARKSLRFTEM